MTETASLGRLYNTFTAGLLYCLYRDACKQTVLAYYPLFQVYLKENSLFFSLFFFGFFFRTRLTVLYYVGRALLYHQIVGLSYSEKHSTDSVTTWLFTGVSE